MCAVMQTPMALAISVVSRLIFFVVAAILIGIEMKMGKYYAGAAIEEATGRVFSRPYTYFPANKTDMIEHDRIIRKKDDECDRLGIKAPLFICAPMVRYSKIAFRRLVRLYGCDLAYTPMIYASCFVASAKCRDVEFPIEESVDLPIVQFAANRPEDFAEAAELVYGRCRGVDLNCGCPKRDVRKCGCGSKLLENPELIAEIVRCTRARISDPDFSVSVKIRIDRDRRRTVDLCRQMEMAGVSHIAVHARTVDMRDSEPADLDALALIKSSVRFPVFANGGCKTYDDALEIERRTNVDGVMAANGILANPALFAGHYTTPRRCIMDWLAMDQSFEIPTEAFHHHLNFMLRSTLPKQKRIQLNDFKLKSDIRNFIESELLSAHNFHESLIDFVNLQN